MPQLRVKNQGIERNAAWAPTHDVTASEGFLSEQLFNTKDRWTAFGLSALGHSLNIDITTGCLAISIVDIDLPYHSLPFRILRSINTQERSRQRVFLQNNPNTDPRNHFFGNWQFPLETNVSPSWDRSYPEILISDGDGEGALYSREGNDFDIKIASADIVEERLRKYGVPGRTLNLTGWKYEPSDFVLRTKRETFSILTGHVREETMVNHPEILLWRFEPITGMAYKYTSQFFYSQHVDNDGLREVNLKTIMSMVTDALGHILTFQPVSPNLPYRLYRLSDGSGRSLRIELNDFTTFLDGNLLNGKVKEYLISKIVDESRPAQNDIQYFYDEDRLIRVVYPGHAGAPVRIVEYKYDTDFNLIQIKDPMGDTLNIDYIEDLLDSDEILIPRLKVSRIADTEGNSVTFKYDNPNKRLIVTFTGPDNKSREIQYDYQIDDSNTRQRYITTETIKVNTGHSGNQIIVNRWEYTTDGKYCIKKITDPLARATQFSYNAFNQIIQKNDPSGHATNYLFDVQNTPTPATPHRYDLTQTSESNFDINGNNFNITNNQSFESYNAGTSGDPADQVQSTHRIITQSDPLNQVINLRYNDGANFFSLHPSDLINAKGNNTTRTYDNTGNLISEIDPENNLQTWSYNKQSQMISHADHNGFTRFWVYDPGSMWLTDITDALGNVAGDPLHSKHFDWNDAGRCIRTIDAVGSLSEYFYYGNKRLKSILHHDINPVSVLFEYDCKGAISKITDGRNNATILMYDEADRLYEVLRNSPANPIVKYVMDLAGNKVLRDQNGNITHYAYDNLNRLTGINEPNWPLVAPVNAGKIVLITYDNLNRIIRVADNQFGNDCLYEFDAAGNLKSKTDHFGWRLDRTYDANNQLIQLHDNPKTIDLKFQKDKAGNTIAVTDFGLFDLSRTFNFSRTDGPLRDNLYRIDFDVSGISTHFVYDKNGKTELTRHAFGGNPHSGYGYVYGDDSQIRQANGNHIGLYTYDNLKQLQTESDEQVSNKYDKAGNRLSRTTQPVAANKQCVYDADNKLITIPYENTNFHYDENGNIKVRQTPAGRSDYLFDGANRLMKVNDGATSIEYLYDYNGKLLQRTSNHIGNIDVERYRYADQSIIAVVNNQNITNRIYTRDDDGRLLRQQSQIGLVPAPQQDIHSLYFLQDGLGNIRTMIDWDGVARNSFIYDAWGSATSNGVLNIDTIFGFRQGYTDLSTGLTNFGFRWYDPTLGRWISQDPAVLLAYQETVPIGSVAEEIVNLYRYVYNNPLNHSDISGMGPFWDRVRSTLIGKLLEAAMKGRDISPSTLKPRGTVVEQAEGKKPSSNKPPVKDEPDNTAKYVAVGVVVVAGVGIGAYQYAKWSAAAALAPETFGLSLLGAALAP